VVSETLLSSSTAFSDSFTAHRLLGPEILNHPLVNVIEFNPIAQTFIAKALDTVIKKEARDSGRRRMPGPAVIQQLSELGDVRSAVNSLEFLCVRNTDADWSGTVAAKQKKGKDGVAMTAVEKTSVGLICQRETTLDMFHAAGKIVYNKRGVTEPGSLPEPPNYLMHTYRAKQSEVDVDALLSETGTDIQTFISTLHENYVLSCNGEAFIDAFEACADILSVSDVLNPDARRQVRSRSTASQALQANTSASSSDALRQDELSFNIATRGLLFGLPSPVNRAATSNGRKGDSFKMFYPVSLRLWKPMEEIDSIISLHSKNQGGGFAGGGLSGVAAWKNTSFGQQNAYSEDADEDGLEGARRLMPSREELVLEILPYQQHIRIARDMDTKILSKITKFTGLTAAMQMMENEPDEEQPKDETVVTAQRYVGASNMVANASGASQAPQKPMTSPVSTAMDSLYLADDDIVDN
jgi:cell cycle checkpoint protein